MFCLPDNRLPVRRVEMFTVGKLSLKWGGENLGEQHCRAHVAGIKAKAQSAGHYVTPLSGITSKKYTDTGNTTGL